MQEISFCIQMYSMFSKHVFDNAHNKKHIIVYSDACAGKTKHQIELDVIKKLKIIADLE